MAATTSSFDLNWCLVSLFPSLETKRCRTGPNLHNTVDGATVLSLIRDFSRGTDKGVRRCYISMEKQFFFAKCDIFSAIRRQVLSIILSRHSRALWAFLWIPKRWLFHYFDCCMVSDISGSMLRWRSRNDTETLSDWFRSRVNLCGIQAIFDFIAQLPSDT